MKYLSADEVVEMFDARWSEDNGPVEVGGYTFDAADILKPGTK